MSALGVETLLAKRWDTSVHEFSQGNIAVASFSVISILFSLMILAKLAFEAKNGGGLKSYDYLFVFLQFFNFATQGIVIYCQTVPMMSCWAENLLQYLAAASILGVVIVNIQTLTIFAVLDLRITRPRIQMIAVTFVLLFFLLATLELRNVFVAGSVDSSSESEIRLHQIGTILVIVFAAIGLLYDNVQVTRQIVPYINVLVRILVTNHCSRAGSFSIYWINQDQKNRRRPLKRMQQNVL